MDRWPSEDLEAVPACPVCGSRDRSVLYDGMPDRVFGIAPGTWTLWRCGECDGAHLAPRPTPASVAAAYAGAYYTHGAPEPEPEPGNAAGRLRRAARNGYAVRRFGVDLRPASALGAVGVALVPPLRADIDRYFRHLRRSRPGARLLDVGAGNGHYVLRMREAGWEAVGLEIDPDAAAAGRAAGLDIRTETLEEAARRWPGAWDAVTMNHVIEHVHDPVGFLRHARALLCPGGRLWVATPNLESGGHRRFGEHWIGLDPPRHLVLFTRGALARAVHAAGFVDARFPVPWSRVGDYRVRSQVVRDGQVPTMHERGPGWPDLVTLLHRRWADDLVLTARR